jgi:uncharacterized protein (TIGR00255 family)
MIKSMTGYGQAASKDQNLSLKIEIKSVNNRYLDTKIRLPRELNPIEQDILSYIRSKIKRGSLNVYITLSGKIGSLREIKFDNELVTQLVLISDTLSKKHGLKGIGVKDILTFPGVFEADSPDPDIKMLKTLIMPVLDNALNAFDSTRIKEGLELKTDLLENISLIASLYKKLNNTLPLIQETLKNNFETKINTLLNDKEIDPARLSQEISILMEKSDINEELVRISAHLDNLKNIINNGGPCGKKTDFYLQELNREINTSLSKLRQINACDILLEMKEIAEKVREQAHNIE